MMLLAIHRSSDNNEALAIQISPYMDYYERVKAEEIYKKEMLDKGQYLEIIDTSNPNTDFTALVRDIKSARQFAQISLAHAEERLNTLKDIEKQVDEIMFEKLYDFASFTAQLSHDIYKTFDDRSDLE